MYMLTAMLWPDARHVSNILEETYLYLSAVEFEITGSILILDAETSIKTLQELKEMSVKPVAVDDCCTGYLSMSYLKPFTIDILKIDRGSAKDIAADSDSNCYNDLCVGKEPRFISAS